MGRLNVKNTPSTRSKPVPTRSKPVSTRSKATQNGENSDKENRSRTSDHVSGTPGSSKKKPANRKQDKIPPSKKSMPTKSSSNTLEDEDSNSDESTDSEVEKEAQHKATSKSGDESDKEADDNGESMEEDSDESEMATDNTDSRDLASDYREVVEEAEKQRIKKKRKRDEMESDAEVKGIEKEARKNKKSKAKKTKTKTSRNVDSKDSQILNAARASAFRFAVTMCMWGEKEDIFWEDPDNYDYTEPKEEDEFTGEQVIFLAAAQWVSKDPTQIIKAQAEYYHKSLPKRERRWWFKPSYQDRFMHVFSRVRGNMMSAIDSHAREVFELDIDNKAWVANRAGRAAVPGVTELVEDNLAFCYPYEKEGKKKKVIYRHPALVNIARRVLKGPSAMLSATGERSSKARKTADRICNIKTFSAPLLLFVMTLVHQSLAGYKELNKNGPAETYYWEMMDYVAGFYAAHPNQYDKVMEHFDEALGLGEQKNEKKVVKKKVRNELDAMLEESDTEDEKAKAKAKDGKGEKAKGAKGAKGKKDNKEGSKEEEMDEGVENKEEESTEEQQMDATSDTQSGKGGADTGQRKKTPRNPKA